MVSIPHQSVRVRFSDGYHYRWSVPDHASAQETVDEVRRTIANAQWFAIPGTDKSYSPYAIVSIEIVTSSSEDEPSTAERLGQQVREHVIDPINENT